MHIVIIVIAILFVLSILNNFFNKQLAKDQKQLQKDYVEKMDSFTKTIEKLTEKVGRK